MCFSLPISDKFTIYSTDVTSLYINFLSANSLGTQGVAWSYIRGGSNWILGKSYSSWVVRHWIRLPRAVVTAPSLPEFKRCLDNALKYRVWFLGVLCGASSWIKWFLCIPSNLWYSMISWCTPELCLFMLIFENNFEIMLCGT